MDGADEPDHGQKVLARSLNAEDKHLLDPERELKPIVVLGDDRQGSERVAVKELVGVEPHKPVVPCGSQLDAVLQKRMKMKKGLLLDSTTIVCHFAAGFMFNPVLLYDLMLSARFAVFCLPVPDTC